MKRPVNLAGLFVRSDKHFINYQITVKILNMKSLIKKLLIITFVVCFSGAMFANVAFSAQKYKLVLFFASWNYASQKARPVFSQATRELNNIEYQELDVDSVNAVDNASKLNLVVPSSIPYYILIGNDGKVLTQNRYRNEDAQQIKQILSGFTK